eukprot:5704951-Alexandrium_andersonii.AAC.1
MARVCAQHARLSPDGAMRLTQAPACSRLPARSCTRALGTAEHTALQCYSHAAPPYAPVLALRARRATR